MSDYEKCTLGQMVIGFVGVITWGSLLLYWTSITSDSFGVSWQGVSALFFIVYGVVTLVNVTFFASKDPSEDEIQITCGVSTCMHVFTVAVLMLLFLLLPESGVTLTRLLALQMLAVAVFLYMFIENSVLLALLRRARNRNIVLSKEDTVLDKIPITPHPNPLPEGEGNAK